MSSEKSTIIKVVTTLHVPVGTDVDQVERDFIESFHSVNDRDDVYIGNTYTSAVIPQVEYIGLPATHEYIINVGGVEDNGDILLEKLKDVLKGSELEIEDVTRRMSYTPDQRIFFDNTI